MNYCRNNTFSQHVLPRLHHKLAVLPTIFATSEKPRRVRLPHQQAPACEKSFLHSIFNARIRSIAVCHRTWLYVPYP